SFISDVGASSIKPLFIPGCCITAISLDLLLLSEQGLFLRKESPEMQSRGDKSQTFCLLNVLRWDHLASLIFPFWDVAHHRAVHESLLILAL
ncbi:uncharacterized protein K444DRAFT_533801, partial [Hyaloscypha bicolor E]